MFGVLHSRSSEDKKALNLSFIFRPQTRYIQYFEGGLNSAFVSGFGQELVFFGTEKLRAKNNWELKLTSNASRGQ